MVTKSVTLNDRERRDGRLFCVILPNWAALGANYVEVVPLTVNDLERRNDCRSALSLQ